MLTSKRGNLHVLDHIVIITLSSSNILIGRIIIPYVFNAIISDVTNIFKTKQFSTLFNFSNVLGHSERLN